MYTLAPAPARIPTLVSNLLASPHQNSNSKREEKHGQSSKQSKCRRHPHLCNHRLNEKRSRVGEDIPNQIENQVRFCALTRVAFKDICLTAGTHH